MRLMERIGRREQAGDEAVVDFYLGRGVVDDDRSGSDDRDLDRFPMRALSSGRQPRFCGLRDTAVYVNVASSQAAFNLAEIPVVHAGKDLVIELWDPDSGTAVFGSRTTQSDWWSNMSSARRSTELSPFRPVATQVLWMRTVIHKRGTR